MSTAGRAVRRWKHAWSVALLGCAALAATLALLSISLPGAMAQSPDDPVVAVVSPAAGAMVSGRVHVEGWAVDPAGPPSDGRGINPRDIQLWLGAYPGGRLLDYAQYGLASEVSMQIFGPPFLRTGFARTWETCSFAPGPYELWAYVSSLTRPGVLGFNKVDLSVQACPAGRELYRADFRDARAWRGLATAQVETGPDSDGWLIQRKVSGASGESPEGVFANFRTEITARLTGRPLNRYYYLQFRQEPGPADSLGDSYYRFAVDPDFGSFDLVRVDRGEEVMLIEETRLETLIRHPEEENRLAVLAEGPRMQVFVNGVLVGEAIDSTYPWGRISFGVGSGGQPDAAAHFRDFVITTP